MSKELVRVNLGMPSYFEFRRNVIDFSVFTHLVGKCRFCSRVATATSPVSPIGDTDSRFVFMGRDPGKAEDLDGMPFSSNGKGGKEFSRYLQALNISRFECYITNALFCYGPKAPDLDQFYACVSHHKELEFNYLQNAQFFFLMGNDAVSVLFPGVNTSVLHMVGCYMKVGRKFYFPLLHPGTVLRQPSLVSNFYESLELVRDLVEAERNKEWRELK